MRVCYLELQPLQELATKLCAEASDVLLWDLAFRFLQENPSDRVVTDTANSFGIPLANLEQLQAISDGIALALDAEHLPVAWQVYQPTTGLSTWTLLWGPGQESVYGMALGDCQRLVKVGVDRLQASKLLRKYGTCSSIMEHL